MNRRIRLAAAPKASPQSAQNLAPGALSEPHFEQRFDNGLPHSAQNFLSGIPSAPHFEQLMPIHSEKSNGGSLAVLIIAPALATSADARELAACASKPQNAQGTRRVLCQRILEVWIL